MTTQGAPQSAHSTDERRNPGRRASTKSGSSSPSSSSSSVGTTPDDDQHPRLRPLTLDEHSKATSVTSQATLGSAPSGDLLGPAFLDGSVTPGTSSALVSGLRKRAPGKSMNSVWRVPPRSRSPEEVHKYGADHVRSRKWKTVATRVVWSLVMVGGFIGLMTMGHVYLIALVFVIQLSVFREVSNLFEVGYKASAREHAQSQASVSQPGVHPTLSLASKDRRRIRDWDKDRWSKLMSWYFFCAVNYFLYGESIIYYFKHIVFIDVYLLPFARHHRFISLLLYLVGFLAFVANLHRGHLRRQFGLFSWIHMSLLLIVAAGQFMVNNILEGLIWFWVPASLVIMNDVAAYVFGMLFGKHQLIKLSPKKTVEGFVGGYFTTVTFAVLWGSLFMGWNYMICPVRELGVTAFSDVQCVPNNAFVWRPFELPGTLVAILSPVWSAPPSQVWYTPFQLHCGVLGTFAGLVAPFGGFFASGFKRAFNIKDFADTIPGHGGLTDRFDCQFIMGLFTYFYYTSMVREQHVTIGSVLEIIASSLNSSEQLVLYHELRKSLTAQGHLLPLS